MSHDEAMASDFTVNKSSENSFMIECRAAGYRLNGGRALLADLNLQVRLGETLVLLGRSGSGKTTTLKLINRLLEPTQGEVLVEGRATTAWDPIRLRRRIGYVIQEVGLFPHFTVERNVGLVPALEGWPPERIRARTQELLRLVDLDPEQFAARRPHELSGGQRQRVGVARALAADPPLLLMDEPFGALDPVTRAELQREFGLLKERLNKTIVFRHPRPARSFVARIAHRSARRRKVNRSLLSRRISARNRSRRHRLHRSVRRGRRAAFELNRGSL
jgi:osmoprotectant transport system ATP-binding protein